MKPRTIAIVFTLGFLVLCGGLILQSFCGQCAAAPAEENAPAAVPAAQPADAAPADREPAVSAPADDFASRLADLSAVQGTAQPAVLGELYGTMERWEDPSKFKFRIELTSRGAAVERVLMSEFDNRFQEERGPLALLFPLPNGRTQYSLANTSLWVAPAEAEGFGSRAFPLRALNWTLAEHDETHAVYEATLGIVEDNQVTEPMLRLRKTYTIEPGKYDLDVRLGIENLSGRALKTRLALQGPCGMGREDIQRDMRKVTASYAMPDGQIVSLDLNTAKLRKAIDKGDTEELAMTPKEAGTPFVWGAISNKYFTAIVRPTEDAGAFGFGEASLHELPGERTFAKDETASFTFGTAPLTLAAGEDTELGMSVFLGPKERELFESVPAYRQYAYFHTIDFRTCCCPTAIIAPIAFGIMWFMKTVYTLMGPLGNYGLVIILLVFLVRLLMHPVTKHQQVSMMKMQKLGPRLQEVQKKYKGNPAELQKQMGAVYAEAGMTQFTPVLSMMLPMLIQMPIWISLWTSVYTSVDLRGAGFLPFWITDLSAPDALISFRQHGFTIPVIHLRIESFNLLPILMGVVMFLQQKLMTKSQPTTASPEMAQQQKIMQLMIPLMFPLFLYNGPSGVNLYIMSSIGAGLIEQLVIRKHLRERQEQEQAGRTYIPTTKKAGGKAKKKKPKPFFRENR